MNNRQNRELQLTGYGGRGRLADQVAQQLAQRIRDGALQPGDQLPTEARLVEELEVSRSVVREAIARLRSEGFVEPRQGKGVFVTDWASCQPFRVDGRQLHDAWELRSVLELRREVESGAAALAAVRRTDEELARLRDCVARMVAAPDAQAASEADVAFHATIAQATHNRYYREFTQYLDRQLRMAVAASHRQTAAYLQEQARTIQDEHNYILGAIEAREAPAARAAVQRHLDNVQARLGLTEQGDD